MTLPQGPVPVSGVFPAGVPLHLLETGIQAIQLSPYHADPPARRSRRLDTTAGFLACYFPRSPFGTRVSHQIPRPLLSSLPTTRAIQRCASWRSYNQQRPHRALQLRPPRPQSPLPEPVLGNIRRRLILGGLIQYEPAA
jgi:hypothetical protein